MSGDRAAMAELTEEDLLKIVGASQAGLTIEAFRGTRVKSWAATAKHPKYQRPYTELVYAPMLEVMRYLRANGYRTYIVTGGGQEFVRAFAESVYGVPPEQVIGTMLKVDYAVLNGVPTMTNAPALFFNDDKAGKPVGINMVIGRRARPRSATPTATSRCSNGPPAAPARGSACSCCTTTPSGASTPTAPANGPLPEQPRRHLHAVALRRGQEEVASGGRDQHEEQLEAHLRVRVRAG